MPVTLRAKHTHRSEFGRMPHRRWRRKCIAALRANYSLDSLYLDTNDTGDHGASALAQAAQTNKSPGTLDLSVKHIGDKGWPALMDNTTCMRCRVGKNESLALVQAPDFDYLILTGS
ncbi:hypothetical protein PHYPSEUDO_009138 [Phytophthora pseudosyringae]|uniref:Uncharacterized protein n=1 Tax=Phytophthora pseudosyringae TaxID=221518 RepID=A0A8T1VFX2_9STRA|nr:hypothetical protein PHYPSEUDO_009138 [Phytophthora pseudosyringae]